MKHAARVVAVKRNGSRTLLAALMMSTAVAAGIVTVSSGAYAQGTSQVSFSIPAGPLGAALATYGRQAGLQVSYLASIASGRTSPGISGAATREQALDRLLHGTGLSWQFTNAGTVTVTDRVSSAHAADDASGSLVLDTIDVSAARGTAWHGNPDAVYATPAGVSVVTSDEVQQRYNGNIDAALRSTPGTFTRMDESGAGVSVNIRGFEGFNRVNMTIDGVRQNFRFFNHGGTGGNTYVDPSLLAGVDVARGSVVDASGVGALAGTANFRTLDVEDILVPGRDWGGMVTAKAGTNGYKGSLSTAGAFRDGTVSGIAAFSYHERNNYKDGNGAIASGTWQELRSGLAKVHLGNGSDHSLSLGGVWYDSDAQFSATSMPVRNQTYTARYAYDPGNDLINLRINGAYNITQGEYKAGSGTAVVRDDGYGIDITNTSRFDLGAAALTLNYGGAYFLDDVDNGNNILLSVGKGRQEVSGAFVTAQMNWGMFEATGGLRYDRYSITGTTQPFLFPAAPGLPVDNSGGQLSPKLTLAASPLSWLQVYGTYEHSFRPPTVSETLFPGVHGFPNGAVANPGLRGERSKGWEAGVNISRNDVLFEGDAFRFKANYFESKVEDYVAFDIVDLNTFRIQFTNLPGKTDVSGTELQASYDAGFAYANLTYTKSGVVLPQGVYTGSGADNLGQLPEDYFTLDVGARFLDRKLTIGGQARWTGPSWRTGLLNIPIPPPIRVDGYTLYDLYATYEINENAKAFISAQNITDVYYKPALKDHLGDPGPGRQIVGGLTVRF